MIYRSKNIFGKKSFKSEISPITEKKILEKLYKNTKKNNKNVFCDIYRYGEK